MIQILYTKNELSLEILKKNRIKPPTTLCHVFVIPTVIKAWWKGRFCVHLSFLAYNHLQNRHRFIYLALFGSHLDLVYMIMVLSRFFFVTLGLIQHSKFNLGIQKKYSFELFMASNKIINSLWDSILKDHLVETLRHEKKNAPLKFIST